MVSTGEAVTFILPCNVMIHSHTTRTQIFLYQKVEEQVTSLINFIMTSRNS